MDSLFQEIIIIVIGSAFFLLVAVGIIILILVYQKRQLRYILEKAELKNQFQHELMKTRLEARDETLNKISKELHDNIGQLLSSSLVLISVTERELKEPNETLQMAGEGLSKAIQELRALSKSLNTQWLEKFSLFENLNAEAARLNASKEFTMSVSHPETISLSADQQLMLFRIVQEAFQNSLKHSRANHIQIKAEQIGKEFYIAVKDDGSGFDVTDTVKQGLGMTNMRNRAALMGGSASWKSDETGTDVLIQLPLSDK